MQLMSLRFNALSSDLKISRSQDLRQPQHPPGLHVQVDVVVPGARGEARHRHHVADLGGGGGGGWGFRGEAMGGSFHCDGGFSHQKTAPPIQPAVHLTRGYTNPAPTLARTSRMGRVKPSGAPGGLSGRHWLSIGQLAELYPNGAAAKGQTPTTHVTHPRSIGQFAGGTQRSHPQSPTPIHPPQPTLELGVVAEAVLRLGHADRQLVEPHLRVLGDLGLGLWSIGHAGGAVGLGDGLDLVLFALGG
jgi:hypothetical protein